jgi:hypothetical protein
MRFPIIFVYLPRIKFSSRCVWGFSEIMFLLLLCVNQKPVIFFNIFVYLQVSNYSVSDSCFAKRVNPCMPTCQRILCWRVGGFIAWEQCYPPRSEGSTITLNLYNPVWREIPAHPHPSPPSNPPPTHPGNTSGWYFPRPCWPLIGQRSVYKPGPAVATSHLTSACKEFNTIREMWEIHVD